MRGSVYFQTAQLTKVIFKEGSLKVNRSNSKHADFQCVASYSTMEAYRQIWNNFGNYLREVWEIKNFERVERKQAEDYLQMKIQNGCSKQYIEKISAALSKLGIALEKFNMQYSKKKRIFDLKKVHRNMPQGNNCSDRAYLEPQKVINNIANDMFKLAATIQFEGGARFKGVRRINISQLQGKKIDDITGALCGTIETKEKGGRVGDILVKIDTYNALRILLIRDKVFKIDYCKYAKAIRNACTSLSIECNSSHAFRWCFAQRRLIEYQNSGYSYDDSLAKVSFEMKHNRKEITEHYIG